MANLSSSLVTVIRSWSEGGVTGKERVGLLITITGALTAGGLTNKLLASAIDLSKIESCGNLLVYTAATGAGLRVYPAVPSLDGSMINTSSPIDATDATRAAIADTIIASGENGQIEVHGYR